MWFFIYLYISNATCSLLIFISLHRPTNLELEVIQFLNQIIIVNVFIAIGKPIIAELLVKSTSINEQYCWFCTQFRTYVWKPIREYRCPLVWQSKLNRIGYILLLWYSAFTRFGREALLLTVHSSTSVFIKYFKKCLKTVQSELFVTSLWLQSYECSFKRSTTPLTRKLLI